MLFLLLVDHLVTPGKCHFVHSVLELESSVSRESSASSVISLCCGATCISVGISLPFVKHESSRHIFACNNKTCPKGNFFKVDAMAPTHLQIYNLEQCGTYVWTEKQILPLWHTWYFSRTPRTYSCKFFLAGVIFYRFNAKNWQFTV